MTSAERPLRIAPVDTRPRPRATVWCLLAAGLLAGAARAEEVPLPDAGPLLPAQSAEVSMTATPAPGADARPTTTLAVDTQRTVQLGAGAGGGVPGAAEQAQWRMRMVRWADAGQASAVGVSVGVGLQRQAAVVPATLAARAPTQLSPEVGLRFRSGWNQDRRVDVDAWRSYERPAANHARVELQFRDAKDSRGLDVPRGAFGIQTSANSQWVLRAKRGGPMVYYRARW